MGHLHFKGSNLQFEDQSYLLNLWIAKVPSDGDKFFHFLDSFNDEMNLNVDSFSYY